MKKILIIVTLMMSLNAYAQREITPGNSLLITGKVLQEIEFNLDDISNFKIQAIPDLVIKNHKGEVKDTVTGLQGFLLKELLDNLEYPIEKPCELNEFYFTFICSDGYKVVFSYNEIYNSETGKALYLVTQLSNKKAAEMKESILVVAANDLNVGPRFIKALEIILVSRVR